MVIDSPMKLSSSFHDASAKLWTDLIPSIEGLVANKKSSGNDSKEAGKDEL